MPAPNSVIAPVSGGYYQESTYSNNDSYYTGGGGYGGYSGGYGAGSGSIKSLLDMAVKPSMPSSTDEKELLKYQEDLQAYNRLITMLTNILQVEHETRKAPIQNFRV